MLNNFKRSFGDLDYTVCAVLILNASLRDIKQESLLLTPKQFNNQVTDTQNAKKKAKAKFKSVGNISNIDFFF